MRLFKLIIALAIITPCATASAQSNLWGYNLHLLPVGGAPGACSKSGVCLFSPANGQFSLTDATGTTYMTANETAAGNTTFSLDDGASAGVCAVGVGCIRYNNTSHVFEQSLNGNAWSPLGGASTLTQAYSNGASAADQTFIETNANGGPVVFEKDSIGAITQANGATLVNKTASTSGNDQFSPSVELDGTQWSGAVSVVTGWQFETEPQDATTTGGWLRWRSNYNGTYTNAIRFTMANNLDNNPGIFGESTTGFYIGVRQAPNIGMLTTGMTFYTDTNFFPAQTINVGLVRPPLTINSYQYATLPQAVSAGGTFSVSASNGGIARLNITSGTAVTGITINAAVTDGTTLLVAIVQPGAGTPESVPTTWTNVSFAGGTFTNTATLGKRDYVSLTWDANTSKWYETTRALNLSN